MSSKKPAKTDPELANKILTEKLESLSDKELIAGIRLLHWAFAAHYREQLHSILDSDEPREIVQNKIARLNTRAIEKASPYLLHEIAYRTQLKATQTSHRIGWISILVAFVSLFVAFVSFMSAAR
jgi:hypothetical protein